MMDTTDTYLRPPEDVGFASLGLRQCGLVRRDLGVQFLRSVTVDQSFLIRPADRDAVARRRCLIAWCWAGRGRRRGGAGGDGCGR